MTDPQQRGQSPDDVMFARGIAGPLGKLTDELKTKVDSTTHEMFKRQCAAQGLDAAVVLRDCVYAMVYKKTYRQMVIEKLSHESQVSDALAKLTGSFGAPESEGGDAWPQR